MKAERKETNPIKDKLKKVLEHPNNHPIHLRSISQYVFLSLTKLEGLDEETKELIDIYYKRVKEMWK